MNNKSILTLLTGKRFLPRVDPDVFYEGVLTGGCVTADVTSEFFLLSHHRRHVRLVYTFFVRICVIWH